MNQSLRIALAVTMAFSVAACNADVAATNFNSEIPDLTQTDIKGQAAGDGQMYCAPVSVSNTFGWLLDTEPDEQIQMARTLAGENYMRTSLKNGTSTIGLLRGVKRYAEANGLVIDELQHQGWRPTIRQHFSGSGVPKQDFVERFVGDDRGAWLNIGWYKRDGKDLRRIGGHWVTLVGYNFDKVITLYVNDPSPRAGNRKTTHKVTLSKLGPIQLTGRNKGLPRNGAGLWIVETGLILNRSADFAIIDGVVGMKIASS